MAYDVGHSSIGWAVLKGGKGEEPELQGCGAVIFQADDCLASQRRTFRRQRRHIRATKQRIMRMKALLGHAGVMTGDALNTVSTSSPWFYAARVLASKGEKRLSWPVLWDVLRWYAHNRGYDGNKGWSRHEEDAAAVKEDTEKVENARSLYVKHGTRTMAETWCAVCGLDPLGKKTSSHVAGAERPKGLNAAFPREDVEREAGEILKAHEGKLAGLDGAMIKALMSDWRAVPCEAIRLPGRYEGGLLFGQLVPRFDNRIIALCPFTYEEVYQRTLKEMEGEEQTKAEERAKATAEKQSKVPAAASGEFLRYRWAMQLANVLVEGADGIMRRLSPEERQALTEQAREKGSFAKGEFKKAVKALTGTKRDNLEQVLTHPDADKALVYDPVEKALAPYGSVVAVLPEQLRKRLRGKLRRGQRVRLDEVRGWLGGDAEKLDAALDALAGETGAKGGRKKKPGKTRETLLQTVLEAKFPSGRAPYSRERMERVVDFVLTTDGHPAEEGGPLYRSEAIRMAQLQRAIDEQTNNHLVRHRLKILQRLHVDVVKNYAGEDAEKVGRITVEVNSEVRKMSGKTAKEIASELGRKLGNFKAVTAKLEKMLAGTGIRITPGLIRKARIADDLGWECPYTGKTYDVHDLIHRRVDKDHIIPRSERESDSLDSLVITFNEVNRMKGKRTAMKFIEDEGGKTVPGMEQVTLKTAAVYQKDVEKLEAYKGHEDDAQRKKNRKRLLLLRDYVEKEFTPRDLTQTSQLVRLAAQELQRAHLGAKKQPVITSLPGNVTGAVRKSWRLLGCLSAANPAVTEETTKTEVRSITHLHHALDACVLALSGHYLPRDGGVWELLAKRHLNENEQRMLMARCALVRRDSSGKASLSDLPKSLKEQIRSRLAEKRVVQHLPADMRGLASKETVWRVYDSEDQHPNARRLRRWLAEKKVEVPTKDSPTVLLISRKRRLSEGDTEAGGKTFRQTKTWQWVYDIKDKGALIGYAPSGDSKLAALKAVKIMGDNYGIALDPKPQLIRPLKVWHQLKVLRMANGGKPVRVLRRGSIVRVPEDAPNPRYRGIWMIRGVTLHQKKGFLVDMSPPDQIIYRRQKGCLESVFLETLLKYGIEILDGTLSGIKPSNIKTTEGERA